jgi:hypothetical protein
MVVAPTDRVNCADRATAQPAFAARIGDRATRGHGTRAAIRQRMVRTGPCLSAVTCAVLSLLTTGHARADWVDEWRAPEPEVSPVRTPTTIERQKATDRVVPESQRVHFDDRPFNLQLRLGVSSNVGLAGVAIEYDVDDRVNVGIGLGLTRPGLVTEAHTRFRPLVFRMRGGKSVHAVVVEGAASRSRYDGISSEPLGDCAGNLQDATSPCLDRWSLPEWVWRGQIEVGWEFRSKTGILVRTTSGVGFLLTPSEQVRITSNGPVLHRENLPARVSQYATTFALGYAFH